MDSQRPNNLLELLDLLDKRGIPKSQHWKYIGRFLESKSRRMHIPTHGVFELTPLCNFDCKMCYVHLGKQQFADQDLLSVKQWKQLADSAHSAGMLTIALTGGECLTYPDFDELYKYLILSGIKVYIMSNGYSIDKKRIDFFKEYKPSKIKISIYGSSNDTYEAVTGVRAFDRVYENIVSIRDAGLNVSLSITPSKYMRNDIENLINLAESLHIKYGVNPQLMLPREETGRIKEDLSLDEYLNIYRFLKSIHHEDIHAVDWARIPEENHGGPQRYGIRCGAGRSSFGIKYDGTMCPCLSLTEITAQPLAIGFEKAWAQISSAAENYALPLECGDCIYRKHCLSCVAVHKSAPMAGHCDPLVCERMKKLVQEGFIPLKNICS